MAEYIEREAVLKKLTPYTKDWYDVQLIPIADVAEVKHGEWLTPQNDTIRGQKFTCSVCGKIAYYPQPTRLKNWVKHCSYEYCPHCGAKMDGKDGAK